MCFILKQHLGVILPGLTAITIFNVIICCFCLYYHVNSTCVHIMDTFETRGIALFPLPLASLRLVASPLQLTYSFVWKVIQKRDVKRYSKVEEFVTIVTQTIPELMSFKQTAQLILGLRARIILDLLHTKATPDSHSVQILINKLKLTPPCTDAEVEKSQTNFMALVQTLLTNCAEKKRFFQDVFPVQYGSKFDAALKALIAGLICKLEQFLPVPDLSTLGALISTEQSVLEACGHFLPDPGDLKILLHYQRPKGLLSINSAISATVGDCVLSSLSFLPDTMEHPEPPEPSLVVPNDSLGNAGGGDDVAMETMVTSEHAAKPAQPEATLTESNDNGAVMATQHEVGVMAQDAETSGAEPPPTPPTQGVSGTLKPPLRSVPFKTTEATAGSSLASPDCPSPGQQRAPTQRVTLHQWVLQVASNSLSLPALPPLPAQSPRSPKATAARQHGGPRALRPTVRYQCAVCDRSFPYQSKLREHERVHTGEKPYACAACPKRFRTQAFLNTHLRTHSAARPHGCGQCGRSFQSAGSLRKHALVHSGHKPFYCPVCNKGLTQATYFKRHMECHTSQLSFPCRFCAKRFPTPFKLANHERWHTRERPHMCELCGRRFIVPSLLKRHMGYHTGQRQYLCSQCGKTFVYLSDLKRHQQDHGPKATVPCPLCQKRFSSKYCLRVHTRIHTREKPYRCSVCDKSFTQIGNLKVHKRLHTGERPYSCDECPKTYKLSSHLNVHKRTHMGKKPWTCDVCGKGFNVPGLLKKHQLLHSRETAGYTGKPPYRSKLKKTKYEDGDASDDY